MRSHWPEWVLAGTAMVALAGLDIAGAVAAKEAALRRSPLLTAAGMLIFVALFWVYTLSLRYVGLAAVTLGWVVLLQVAVVAIDRLRYGVEWAPGVWAAILVLLGAQAYLILTVAEAPPSEPR